jgi:uncharacterized protein YcbK (DUF882 family)
MALVCAILASGGLLAVGPARLAAAFSDTRTIAFYNIHTKETLTVLYKRKGQYVPEAMDKIDWILRDWRRNEKTKMDPKTIDILWEMHTELGSAEPIHVISGYRSPGTNDMLRRTVGGQASNSQHITGKAVDVSFPDVPIRQVRYAAMVRELGGVGYYPTSGIPFVHVDTGRVRHWPRMPRHELALLFPNGSSKHHPSDGSPISADDVRAARASHRDLAGQMTAFFDLRRSPKPPRVPGASPGAPGSDIQVAGTGAAMPRPPVAQPGAPADTQVAGTQVAALTPMGAPLGPPRQPVTAEPRLLAEPRRAVRPPRTGTGVTPADQAALAGLMTRVTPSDAPLPAGEPQLVQGPRPVPRSTEPATIGDVLALVGQPRTAWIEQAALDPATAPDAATSTSVMSDAPPPSLWDTVFAAAPEFDEEHPEELAYRPFPIGPLLTATVSIDDPEVSRFTAPDIVRVLKVIDDVTVPPLRFRPDRETAETMWGQQARGEPVTLADGTLGDGAEDLPTTLIPRGVPTVTAP